MNEEEKKIIENATVEGKFLMYRDRPLVRDGNIIIYGNMSDEYVLKLIIITETEYAGKSVPDRVLIQIVNTDASLSENDKIVKQDMAQGLSKAMELGMIWLEKLIGA